MESRQSEPLLAKRLLAGGSVLLAVGLLMDLNFLPAFSRSRPRPDEVCQEVVQPQAKLSREQLARLLSISEGEKKQHLREILKEPYCELEALQIRVGATAQREVYPLAFDPQTWLIVLYEGDQYAGYRFNFR